MGASSGDAGVAGGSLRPQGPPAVAPAPDQGPPGEFNLDSFYIGVWELLGLFRDRRDHLNLQCSSLIHNESSKTYEGTWLNHRRQTESCVPGIETEGFPRLIPEPSSIKAPVDNLPVPGLCLC